MSELFRLITPLTYWVLIVLWTFILCFYVKRMWHSKTQQLFPVLILILAIDAFRTVFESIYFGTWYTSQSGIIPASIGAFLMRPEFVIIPKVLNVIAAILVIALLLKRWLPEEESAKVQMGEDLRSMDEQLHAVWENAIDAIGIFQNGIHLLVNPAYVKMFCYEQEEDILERPLVELIAENEREKIKHYALERLRGRDVETFYETRGLRKDGTEFDMEVSVSEYGDGSNKNTLLIVRDSTERKKAEKEKENLKNSLTQAQKMEAIGTLAGGIAHDFNNILSVIIGYAELAKEDIPEESGAGEKLDKVLYGGNRAKDLVQQILTFSRQNETERSSVEPTALVKGTMQMLRATLPTTIEINKYIQQDCSHIFADPTQISQILMNLCTNAYHAMEDTGGKLDISLKEKYFGTEDLVHHPNIEPGTFIHLSVSDSGPGIPLEIRDKIFEPYYTTKKTGKGTGLGLSIVHGIVKSYDGFISLYSEIGEGTAFHVFLPAIKGENLSNIDSDQVIRGGHEKVLFIDDEVMLAEMGRDMLEAFGYEVTIRSSSLEALETFQNQLTEFDLVITDQTMPGMTGAELSLRLLEMRPDIPIILCSGYSSVISEEKALSMGIKKFALKPLTKKDLARLARMVLDKTR